MSTGKTEQKSEMNSVRPASKDGRQGAAFYRERASERASTVQQEAAGQAMRIRE